MSTALRSFRLLDALFKYACGVFGRAPCIHGTLHLFVTKPREKCGLTSNAYFDTDGMACLVVVYGV